MSTYCTHHLGNIYILSTILQCLARSPDQSWIMYGWTSPQHKTTANRLLTPFGTRGGHTLNWCAFLSIWHYSAHSLRKLTQDFLVTNTFHSWKSVDVSHCIWVWQFHCDNVALFSISYFYFVYTTACCVTKIFYFSSIRFCDALCFLI